MRGPLSIRTYHVTVLRNLAIVDGRPRTSPRSTAAGTTPPPPPPGEADIIIGRPDRPSSIDRPEPANNNSLKRNCCSAAQAAQPDRAGQSRRLAHVELVTARLTQLAPVSAIARRQSGSTP